MKRLYSLLLSGFVTALAFSGLNAQTGCGENSTDVVFCVGSACEDAGAEVCVPVFIANFVDLAGIDVRLDYPAANLQFVRVDAAAALDAGTEAANPEPGLITILWNDPTLAGVSVAVDEPAFELCFQVTNEADSPITFNDPEGTLRVFDALGNSFPTGTSPGSVNGAECGDGGGTDACGADTENLSVCLGRNCEVGVGEETCVPVRVGNFTAITALDFEVNYAADNLTFTRVTSRDDLPAELTGNSATAGLIRMQYFDPNQTGATLANGEILGSICFTNNSADRTDLTITEPTGTNADFDNLTVEANPGQVNGCDAQMPTCDDGVQNGDETGVDCGGSCAPCMTGGGGPDDNCGMGTDDLSVCLGDVCDVAVGASACVPITVGNFTAITALDFEVNFPAANLEFDTITTIPELPAAFGAGLTEAGLLRVRYFEAEQVGATLPDGSVVGEICFTNNSEAASRLTLDEIVGTNADFESLSTTGSPGSINGCSGGLPTCDDGIRNGDETGVDCGGTCEPCMVDGDDPLIRVADGFGAADTEVCLRVSARSFTDVTAFQLPFTFDADKVTFNRVASESPFGNLMVDSGTDGAVVVSWTGPAATVDDDAPLFDLCFTVGEQCNTPVTIETVGATAPTITGADGPVEEPVFINGTLNGGIPCGDAEPAGNMVLSLSSAGGGLGTEVCLDLSAEDFTNITDLSLSLSFNASTLTFSGVNSFGLPGLSAANVANPAAGQLTLDWSSATAGGESLADGSVLAAICFTVDQVVATTVRITDAPLALEAVNSDGADVRIVPGEGQVNGSSTMVDGLTFQIGSAVAMTGDTVCLPVTGFQMDSLVSFQYTVTYDPSVLEFIGRGGDVVFPLDGTILSNEAVAGAIRIIWSDPRGQGENSLADGTDLYSLCFRVLTEDPTVIAFGDSPVPIEVLTVDGEVAANLIDGQINPGEAPTIVGSVAEDPTCSDLANGFIRLQIAGEGNFTYTWTGTDADGPIANNLTAGEYTVVVSNAAGEADTMSFTLTAPIPFQIAVEEIGSITCSGTGTGSIRLATIGGTTPFLIDWGGDLPDNVLEQTGLSGGTYSVTVTDANGCRRQFRSLTVQEPEPLLVAGMIVSNDAGGEDINVVTQGGTSPYRYAWSGPDGFTSNQEDQTGLTVAGTYCVTVTDANDCTAMTCFELGAGELTLGTVEAVDGACAEDGGQVIIRLDGGLAPFLITTEPGGTETTTTARRVELDLPAGSYTFTITDARDSTVTAMAEVATPPALTTDIQATSDTEEIGCTGAIDLNLAGGTPEYTIAWSNDSTTAAITALCAGTYSATVTDANGCTLTTGDIVIGQLVQALDSITPAACEDGTDGGVFITTSGGIEPYTYSWELTGAPGEFSTDEDLEGVMPGDYVLTTTDATGAQLVRAYTVDNESGFSVVSVVSSLFNGFGVSCADATDGAITTTVTGEGTFTFEYILNDEMISADQNLTAAAAGTYVVRVTGDGGCTVTNMVDITAPPALATNSDVFDVTCDDREDGRIIAAPTGGVPPYSLTWSTGARTPQLTDLAVGDYALTVTDGNGCTLSETYTIAEPESLVFTFDATDATDDCNGSIEVLPLGGSGTYVFTWPDLPNQGNDPLAEDLCPGTYTIIVADENGCQSVTMTAVVRDRRFPCLSTREVLTPNQDGLNETLVIFCSGDDVAADNDLEIYNRYGQLVFEAEDYDCSDNDGVNCFDGRTNDGALLPDGAYYFIFNYTNPIGEREQLRSSFTLLRE